MIHSNSPHNSPQRNAIRRVHGYDGKQVQSRGVMGNLNNQSPHLSAAWLLGRGYAGLLNGAAISPSPSCSNCEAPSAHYRPTGSRGIPRCKVCDGPCPLSLANSPRHHSKPAWRSRAVKNAIDPISYDIQFPSLVCRKTAMIGGGLFSLLPRLSSERATDCTTNCLR
jgi:hypothetical protein